MPASLYLTDVKSDLWCGCYPGLLFERLVFVFGPHKIKHMEPKSVSENIDLQIFFDNLMFFAHSK